MEEAGIYSEHLPAPPPAPRQAPKNFVWRALGADGGAIVGFVFSLLGGIFTILGLGLSIAVITLIVGIPFLLMGLVFLGIGLVLSVTRYQAARRSLEVLQRGEAVRGEVVDLHQNLNVQINGQNPWTIIYRFQLNGNDIVGKVTTLSFPGIRQRPGSPVYVLFLPEDPTQNSIYPSPHGYLTWEN
jgi:membrane protein implicated in regulation of membrane protease activity